VNQTAAAALLIEAQMNASALYEEMTYLIERYVRHNANADRNWTFIGALYFVFTVVTTIGYGTFVPSTDAGKALTVVIGIAGVGTFANMLNGLRDLCTGALDRAYSRTFGVALDAGFITKHRRRLCAWHRRHHYGKLLFIVLIIVGYWLGLAALFDFLSRRHIYLRKKDLLSRADLYRAYFPFLTSYYENEAAGISDSWGFGNGMYYTAITFLTIGLGDYSVSWSGDELRALLEVATFVACTCIGIVLFLELSSVASKLSGGKSPLLDESEAESCSQKKNKSKLAQRLRKGSAKTVVTANMMGEASCPRRSARAEEAAASMSSTGASIDEHVASRPAHMRDLTACAAKAQRAMPEQEASASAASGVAGASADSSADGTDGHAAPLAVEMDALEPQQQQYIGFLQAKIDELKGIALAAGADEHRVSRVIARQWHGARV